MSNSWHFYLMAAMYCIAGLMHFIKPRAYMRIMPRYLPNHKILVYLSGLAEDLSGQMYNPYSNLGVATQAAEMQTEQADIALANTLDTLRATGASAGGATALAQAALQSKQGISANIEKQEAENSRLRAQGEAYLQQAQIQEQQRIQGVELSEGARVQDSTAKGLAFQQQMQEDRYQDDLAYQQSLQNFGMQVGMGSMNQQWGALGSFATTVGGMSSQGAFDDWGLGSLSNIGTGTDG
jgi:hypothetical protein